MNGIWELISIITPTYNSEKFIKETLNLIISQTYQNWELLITDDCSTDNTYKILQEYAKLDTRIKVFKLPKNSGAGVARNNSIKYAKGRFIAFCDSDDLWKKDKLEKQINSMLENDIAISYTDYETISEEGKFIKKIICPKLVSHNTILKNDYIGFLTLVYDTKYIEKTFLPKIRRRQDWALKIKLLKRGFSAHKYPEILASYRTTSNSISSNKFKLLKYNWKVFYTIENYNFLESLFLMSRFLFYYFQKKIIQNLN